MNTLNIPRDIRLKQKGGRVLLRPPIMDDGPALVEAIQVSAAALSPWMDWYRADFSIEMANTWIKTLIAAWEDGTNYQFSIIDTEKNQILGSSGINHINITYRLANLGYWIRTDRSGEGFATETTKVLAQFGFEQLGLRRIEIVTGVENWASRRVAEKAGATFEGILRRRLKLGDNNIDAAMFSLIPEDHQKSTHIWEEML